MKLELGKGAYQLIKLITGKKDVTENDFYEIVNSLEQEEKYEVPFMKKVLNK